MEEYHKKLVIEMNAMKLNEHLLEGKYLKST